MIKKFLTLLVVALLGLSLPAYADFPVGFPSQGGGGGGSGNTTTTPGGQSAAGFTCTLVSVPASNTQVTLTASSSYITIVNTSPTSVLYFNTVSPATVTNFPILPNSAYCYSGVALGQFYLISNTGTVSAGVVAH